MKYWYRLVIFLKSITLQKKQRFSLEGDISDCSFDVIKTQLSGMQFNVFKQTNEGYMVRFWDDYTEYVLSFTSGGKVKQIELEHEYLLKANRFLFCDTTRATQRAPSLSHLRKQGDFRAPCTPQQARP